MARRPKPWFWQARDGWYVTIAGVRHPLGEEEDKAYDRFYALMRQPQQRKISTEKLAAVADAFLEWVLNDRSSETFEWYRYHSQHTRDTLQLLIPTANFCDVGRASGPCVGETGWSYTEPS